MPMIVNHTFTPPDSAPLDPGATRSMKPKTNKAEFGDGFSQRSRKGPNNMPWTRKLSWTNLDETEKKYIDGFLTDRGGVESFFYQKHDEDTPRVYICEEWDVTDVGYDTYSITATFQQVYDLG